MLAVDMEADSSFGPASLPIVLERNLYRIWLRKKKAVAEQTGWVACGLRACEGQAIEEWRRRSGLVGGASLAGDDQGKQSRDAARQAVRQAVRQFASRRRRGESWKGLYED